MEKSKWEFKAHSHQIADTGDYDGYYEITNGDITLITKDDYEETERQLKTAVAALNRWGINFYDQKVEDSAIDIYCMKDAQKWKNEEFAALQAKCNRYESLLQTVHQKAKEGIFPHLPVETMGAQKCIEIDAMLNEAISAGEGEKENKPEGWPHVCHVCGKQDCESDHK
jgi:hypothetical protein